LITTPHTKLTDLANHISHNKGKILIVSDASLNAQHCSAFSWTIATANTELWNGAGTSPSMQWDAHSGCSEGCGLLAAFTFIEKYIQASTLQLQPHPATVHGYCNNSGLIQNVTALLLNTIPNPPRTITNDHDLSNKMYQTILRIPLPIKLHHVKGHQDKNTNIKDLSYEAKLNIACNEHACNNLTNLPPNLQLHPPLPKAFPHLWINQCLIGQQLSLYMREQALLPAYYKYLTQKFRWHLHTMDPIEWCSFKLAIRYFTHFLLL